MKKIYLLLLLLSATVASFGQTLINDGFEVGNTDGSSTFSNGWTTILVTGVDWAAGNGPQTRSRVANTGTWYAYQRYSSSGWMVKQVPVVNGNTYRLSYWIKQDGTGTGNVSSKAAWGTTATDAGLSNVIVASSGHSSAYVNRTGTFVASSTGNIYVGIYASINITPWYNDLDDVSLVCLNPDITDWTAPTSANVCSGSAGSVVINSTSLGAATTFTVNYTLSGANTGTYNFGVTMGATNGTISIPASQLTNTGNTTVTINSIKNAAGYLSSPTSSNSVIIAVLSSATPANPVFSTITPTCNSITFNWGAATAAGGYQLETATNAGFTTDLTSVFTGNVLTYTIGSLNGNTQYFYRIRSINSCATPGSPFSGYATGNINTTVQPVISGGATAICADRTTTLTGTPAGGTWTSGNTALATVSGLGVVSGVGVAGAPIISYVAGGCYALRTQTITAVSYPLPFSVSPNPALICGGSPLNLTVPAITASTSSVTATNATPFNISTGTTTTPASGSSSSVTVSGIPSNATITRATLRFTSTGLSGLSWQNDYSFVLEGPGGTICLINNPTGGPSGAGSATNFTNVCFASSGGSALAAVDLSNGTWTPAYGNPAPANMTADVRSNKSLWSEIWGQGNGTWTFRGISYYSAVTTVQNWALTIYYSTPSGSYVWSGNNLYTDAAGTIAYTGTAANSVYANPAASTTYTVSAMYDGSACVSTNTRSVSVGSTPTITLGPSNLSTCSGTPTVGLTYTGVTNLPTTYSINWGSGVFSTVTDAPLTASPITIVVPGAAGGSTVYSGTLTVKNAAGCTSANMPFTVTVHNQPTLTASAGDARCNAGAVSLTATAGVGTVNWFAGATGGPSLSTGSPYTPTVLATTTYYVDVINGTCSLATRTPVVATVNSLPSSFTATASPNPVCVDGTISLTGAITGGAGSTYAWTGPGTITNSTSLNASVNSVVLGNAGVYTLVATVPTCGTTQATTAAVVVNPRPVISFTSAPGTTSCTGVNYVYTTQSGHSNYIWSIPGVEGSDYNITGGSTSASSNSVTIQWLTPSSKTVTVNYTHAVTGCTGATNGSSTTNVTQAPFVYAMNGGGAYCSGGTGVTIGLDLSENGVSYQLFNGATPVGSPVMGNGAAINFGLQTAPGSYSAVGTNTLTTCASTMSGSASVSTTSVPNLYTVTGGGTICSGDAGVTITLSDSDPGVAYRLFIGATPMSGVITGDGNPIVFPAQTTSGNYIVVANPGSACATTMNGSATVTVNSLPGAIGGVLTTCVSASTTLSNSVSGAWTTANTTLASVNSSTGVVTGVAAGSPVITFTASGTGCRRTATVTVSPAAGTITGPSTYCVGGSATLSNAATGGVWSSSSTSLASISSSTGAVTALGAGAPVITYSTGPGCLATKTFSIVPLPTLASVTASSAALCTGATLTLTGGSTSGLTGSATSYNWSGPSSYSSTSATNSRSLVPTSTTYTGNYSLTVTYPGQGCVTAPQSTALVTVSNAPSLASATNNGPVCAGDQLVFTANTASNVTTYAWAGPVAFTGGAATASATIAATSAAAAGNYTVTVSNAGGTGCAIQYYSTGIVNALPAAVVVSGGGGSPICGSTTLTASNGGSGTIFFQGTTALGTSTATPSILQVVNATNTYYFRARSAAGCWGPAGSAAVTIAPLPTAFAITGGGSYCTGGTGVTIGLAGSENGVSYQLYNGAFASGAPVVGGAGGGAISFGIRTTPGTYFVVATGAGPTSCTNNMTGTTTVAETPVPNVYSVVGGGNYCNGGAGMLVGLSGSDAGVSYQLYNNGVAVGSLVTGTGAGISFGLQTTAGSYSVVANPAATCATAMSGGTTISITSLPTAFTAGGSGSYCPGSTGLHVTLGGSQTLTNYQLYKDGVASGAALGGTGAALDFGLQTAGNYTIVATNTSTACTNTMTGTVAITTSALPTVFATTGGGGYCSGGTGVAIGLAGSQPGVNYTLYHSGGIAVAPVGGTGSAISFGLQTVAGSYTVVASNATTSCSSVMSGNPAVTITSTPAVFNMVGGGNQCAGGLGFDLGISGSTVGVSYQLYRDGVATGPIVMGTGAALDMGLQTVAGNYTVKGNPGTTCETNMSGTATINLISLPNAFTVTGGGTYCIGGSGFNVGINGSESGIDYQLYKDGAPVGSPIGGGSGAINFGVQTAAGVYKVVATNPLTTCSRTMTDSAIIIVHPAALVHNVTGGGQYCEGGSGVVIGVDASEVGVTYQLYKASLPVGSVISGTGLPISFGSVTDPGQYAVVGNPASTCATTMTNSVTVTMNPKPTQYNVTGTGSYCAGGTGLAVGLSGSNTGISYQLYRNGSLLGSAMPGTNGALNFGLQTTAGTYTVLATNNTTGCQNNMAGQAAITVNAAPTVYSVTGGGGYCNGGTGVHVGLSGSTSGIKYQLYNGVIPQGIAVTGTGSALDFGLITLGGTYTVIAQDPVTLCTANMSGSTAVVVNSLPTAYTASGTGSFCAGGAGINITLSNSTSGVNYQLYNASGALGTPVAGTNSSLDFGAITTGGTYTIVATNGATGCKNNMTGNPVITVNPLPTVQSVNGGGAYCQGGTGVLVGLANSQSGVTYTLMRGASPAGSVTSTGGAFNFSLQTVAGTYTVLATTGLGCSAVMSGLAVVTMNPLPTAYTVSGTGAYCSGGTGINVTLSSSATGIDYRLYNGGTPVSTPMPGTGAALNFGPQTAAGTYTVQATNTTTGCTNIMSGSAVITVNTTPALATVTGGGPYCAGGTGVHIGLTSPTTSGISYQLVNGSGSIGAPIVSTGGAVDFGLITGAGTYSVIATNTVTGCSATMSGNATVTVNALPQIYTVSGGGVYCSGGNGFSITTNGSNLGINYQLMLGGSPVGSAMPGTGSGLNFGAQTAPGAYTVVATNATTGCSVNMSGTATISVNAAPAIYAMTGGGSYCSGGTGVELGLTGSVLGISYQLYNGSTLVTTVAGTNSAISFGSLTAAGTYTVNAVNSITGCQSPMSGFKSISINALPLVYTVSGTGSYCQGGAGVAVVMNNSESTVNYQLYRGATMVGSPVQGVNGPLSFGAQMTGGVYTVVASNITTGCTSNMAGSATVTVNPLPTMYTVTGGGNYCQGGTGVNVGLNASNTGINYKLYNGATLVGSMNGTGSGFNFGLQTTVGTYTVLATNISTGCSTVMSGVANVGTNALPAAQTVTGGGNYCSNDAGVAIGLANSVSGINYQLYRGSTPVGLPVAGVDGPLSFQLQTVAGTYSVSASDATTGCSMGMTGGATVGINLAPTLFTVTGGGNYCQGGSGMQVGLSSSTIGVEYELFLNGSSTGIIVSGDGNPISFGLQAAVGTYSVNARNVSTNCSIGMSGVAVVGVNNLPNVYTILGAASTYCAGGAGIDMILTNSQVGVNYQLINGSVAIGFAVPGTGTVLDFGNQTVAGTYIVQATNATTGCSTYMASSASVVISPLPTIYTVTGGGGYCAGTAGAPVGLSSSNTGITYKLYRGATLVDSRVGTGSALDFGPQTAGAYTVVASNNTTTCTSNMAGGANVSVNTLPATYTVTGGGNYCSGGAGVAVGLSNSQTGVNYQLYNGTAPVGFPVPGTSGSPVTFGAQTGTGSYTVMGIDASTNCGVSMTGAVTIGTNLTPDVFTVTGGGHFCNGGAGVAVGLSNSVAGITYQLYNGSALVATVMGTGSPISFGTQATAGSYAAVATNTVTGCSSNMSGTPAVTIDPLPTVFVVGGGGSYCAGGSGVAITLSSSHTGINYQLYNGSSTSGLPVAGSGAALNLGMQTAVGTYSVMATNASTGCMMGMAGSATVSITNVVTPSVTIASGMGDSVCAGVPTSFTATTVNGGTSPTYSWTVNGGPTGVSGATLTYMPTNGDVVAVSMTSNAACATPATANDAMVVSVLPIGAPSVNVTADPGNQVCEGTTVMFTAAPTLGGTAPAYYWVRGTTVVGTGSTFSYVPNDNDVVYCMMVSNYTCRTIDTVFSNTTRMEVDPPVVPTITITADPGVKVHPNALVTLTAVVTNAGTSPTFQWYIGSSAIPGATGATLSSSNFSTGDSITCVVTSSSACKLSAFNSVVITVFPVGVDQVTVGNSDIKLMPNPSKGWFTVKGTLGVATDEEVTLEVTNMLGQIVYSNKIVARNGNIDERIQLGSNLANGMYMLNLKTQNGNKVFHIVVEQ